MILVKVHATEKPVIQFRHFILDFIIPGTGIRFLWPQGQRVNINGKLGTFKLPQEAGILHIRLFDHLEGLMENGNAHRGINIHIVSRRNFEPAEHLPFRVVQCSFRRQFRPLLHAGEGNLTAHLILEFGLEYPLCHFHIVTVDRVALQPGVRDLAVLIHIPEYHVFQIPVFIECNRVKAPVHCPAEIDMPVLNVRIWPHRHAARRASLKENVREARGQRIPVPASSAIRPSAFQTPRASIPRGGCQPLPGFPRHPGLFPGSCR